MARPNELFGDGFEQRPVPCLQCLLATEPRKLSKGRGVKIIFGPYHLFCLGPVLLKIFALKVCPRVRLVPYLISCFFCFVCIVDAVHELVSAPTST
mmetsp:Transcript_98/g.345  ORF Transcript_98/g.345 Transcript_98/m.345 type:complete len:96 (+) Transcript_98:213-500(+)